MTGVAYICFPDQAKGSLQYDSKKQVKGSSLIGQNFSDNRYFWPRPSAIGYNPLPSGGSNMSVASYQLRDSVVSRQQLFRTANGLAAGAAVPGDMVFTSASGLDPHISPDGALAQMGRVVEARKCSPEQRVAVQRLVKSMTQGPQFGFMGNSRVNVFMLNSALDSLMEAAH
jgi:K+-transporting ATPase ATPase C chain